MRQEARLPLWLTPPESLLNEPVLGKADNAGGGAIGSNGGTLAIRVVMRMEDGDG